jgi:hypothetical protein
MGHFIETNTEGRQGVRAEKRVWDVIKSVFNSTDTLGFWHYPIFLSNGRRNEPDILLFDKELGTIVIEVKDLNINNIKSITGHQWNYQGFYESEGNPYEQAETQLNNLMNYIEKDQKFKGKISKRVLVALPSITRDEWESRTD